ncbi:MAG: potassium-transporting ATPase subunit KdpA [Candidatus Sumerlaeaceae bacterium]|nr:potassium-transporting ATPase subunit KdpA [Candidatus Sumerlaeaceae bacterium]
MTSNSILQVLLYIGAVLALAKPLGNWMANVYEGRKTLLGPLLNPVEHGIYRLAGIDPEKGMTWKSYATAFIWFSMAGLALLYLQLRVQGMLPLNPAHFSAVPAFTAFNVAASFSTNTNWQSYGGESTMSYLTQMLGLGTQNFTSAAAGLAVLVALIRGFVRRETHDIGNFWVDLVRGTVHILLPLAVVFALFLVSQGVVQTFAPYQDVTTLDGGKTQTLALGPVASQVAIKQLGTNGGGFFNANSAHPFENPTPLSNFFEMLALILLPAALCHTFGRMVGDTRQGWLLLAVMTMLLVIPICLGLWVEQRGNPRFAEIGLNQAVTEASGKDALTAMAGGNMEGKESRFGITNSVIWSVATTAASNGSVNSMHDSFTPLGGLLPMWMMQLGEVVFGGVGSGLYGMLVFVIVAVFVAGLMVGRTPEYLGKKIGAYEMKMASLVILIPPALVLVCCAIAVVTPAALAARSNPGAHGFSQVLYAFSSMGNNNGSAFGGLGANAPFYNLIGGLAMLMARFWLALPVLAIAGSLARKKFVPPSPGTLPTHNLLFGVMLTAVVVGVGALTFLPALALGPIVEHLALYH